MSAPALASVANQVLWNRLLAVVVEPARAPVRRACSPSSRQSGAR